MSTGYEPNIEGALAVLVDLMIGEGVAMVREPYAPNFRAQDFATAIAIALG